MKGNNIETEFIQFIIDKYSPNAGATASKDDDQKFSDNADEGEDEAVTEKLNIHKIQMLNDRIRTNRKKLSVEQDSKKRQIRTLQIWIDQYEIRMERLKA